MDSDIVSDKELPLDYISTTILDEQGIFLSDWMNVGSIAAMPGKLRELADILEAKETKGKTVLNDWIKKYTELLNKYNNCPNELELFELGDIIGNILTNNDVEGRVIQIARHGYVIEYTRRWKGDGCIFIKNEEAQKNWVKIKPRPKFELGQIINGCKILSFYDQGEQGFSYLVELAPYNGTSVFHINEEAIENYRVPEPHYNIEGQTELPSPPDESISAID